MKNTDTFQNEQEVRLPNQGNEKNDLLVILSLLMDNWYYFFIAIIITSACARFYIRHTMAVYQTTATVLINETEDRPLAENYALLQGLGLPGGMRNLQNQIMILKSRALTEITLNELPFELEFYTKTIRNKLPIYPEAPVTIVSDNRIPLPKDTEFSITYLGNNRFSFDSESDYFPLQKTASFGDTIEITGGSLRIICNDEEWFNTETDRKLYLINHSISYLVKSYKERINVQQISRDGSVLNVSMLGTNPKKDAEFLNKHVDQYQNLSLNRKNIEAERRIRFIDDQLVGISDSLLLTENRLQQFRSANRVMDLSAQGQALIGQITHLENERARLSLEADYFDYLSDYLSKDASGEMPIVPITMGISDPGLTRLVEELATLQGQLSTTGAGGMNPLQRNLEQRVSSSKDALRETLNGLRRANSLARSENQAQINRANTQASSLPVTERQLLGIERKFKLNDELYTFLLETRAEQQMQKASNRADSEVVDPADPRFSILISPNPIKTYLIGFFTAILFAFMVVYLKSILYKKLKDKDIKNITDIPVVGKILHNDEKNQKVVFSFPDSVKAEAFRLLRSRMQFFTKDTISPIILVTSSSPGEGKTHITINLASAYSLLGKKTIIVGFDLRKPRLFEDFNLSNEKGVSTWLIGQDNIQDIVQETSFDNLYVITAGPIPPNPSELIALERAETLIHTLKDLYDYIIIDSPPIGVVSDTFHLTTMADACILVVRLGYTLKNLFESTLIEVKANGIKGLSLVINDVKPSDTIYGYGEKYGYTGDKKRLKKHLLKRKKLNN